MEYSKTFKCCRLLQYSFEAFFFTLLYCTFTSTPLHLRGKCTLTPLQLFENSICTLWQFVHSLSYRPTRVHLVPFVHS